MVAVVGIQWVESVPSTHTVVLGEEGRFGGGEAECVCVVRLQLGYRGKWRKSMVIHASIKARE